MVCNKCGSNENVEIGGKIFCASCGSLVYKPLNLNENISSTNNNSIINNFDHQIIESEEFIDRIPITTQVPEESFITEDEEKIKQKTISFKPFFILSGFLILFLLIILSFFFQPFINYRESLIKYTQPVSEINFFKNQLELAVKKARSINKNNELIMVDMGIRNNNLYRIDQNKYYFACLFSSPFKKDLEVIFINKNKEEILGSGKINQEKIEIISDDNKPISFHQLNYLANDIEKIVEINGLKDFLDKYNEVYLYFGPALLASKKYNNNYWLFIYKSKDNKHKFMAKVNAQNGEIIEISQR